MIYAYQFYLVKILGILCMQLKQSLSDINVYNENGNATATFRDLPALFGSSIPSGGYKGYVIYVSPSDGCSQVNPPPKFRGPFFALVKRYNCSFVEKVLNAQYAGYKAVIVRNVGSNSVEVMSGNQDSELVDIPSVFIGQDDGILIQTHYQYNKGYFIIITDDLPFNIQNYLLPFAITVGICFVLMLTFMLVKCIRDYRRSRRHRLSSRALKKLPIHKFKKGDPYECCAICLEDYLENDKLRVLPCSHAYHMKCIDPWLTKNRRVCPVCKRKVIIGDEQPSDYDSSSEDETSPLINSEGGTQGGTFTQQRENPFQEAERRRHNSGLRRDHRSRTSYHHLDESSSEESDEEEREEEDQYAEEELRNEATNCTVNSEASNPGRMEISIEQPHSEQQQNLETKDCVV